MDAQEQIRYGWFCAKMDAIGILVLLILTCCRGCFPTFNQLFASEAVKEWSTHPAGAGGVAIHVDSTFFTDGAICAEYVELKTDDSEKVGQQVTCCCPNNSSRRCRSRFEKKSQLAHDDSKQVCTAVVPNSTEGRAAAWRRGFGGTLTRILAWPGPVGPIAFVAIVALLLLIPILPLAGLMYLIRSRRVAGPMG